MQQEIWELCPGKNPHHSVGLRTQYRKHGDCGPWTPFPLGAQLQILTQDVWPSCGNKEKQGWSVRLSALPPRKACN